MNEETETPKPAAVAGRLDGLVSAAMFGAATTTKAGEAISMRWERDTGKYASGKILYLGKWKVGGFHFDSCRSQGDPKKWEATCSLPGIKRCLGHFAKEEEAVEAAEKSVKHWLSGLPSNG